MQSVRRVALSFCLLIVVFAVAGVLWLKYNFAAAQGNLDEITRFFSQPAAAPHFVNPTRQPCRENNPQRNPYFGALHIHTLSLSEIPSIVSTVLRTSVVYHLKHLDNPLAMLCQGLRNR